MTFCVALIRDYRLYMSKGKDSVGWYVRNSNGVQLLETEKASGVVDLEVTIASNF